MFKSPLDEQQFDEIRQATNGNYVLGNASFEAEIAAALGRSDPGGKAGRPPKQEKRGRKRKRS